MFNLFPPRVQRLPSGAWIVAGDEDSGHLELFESIGAEPQKIGRRGSGPGEFQAPRQVLAYMDKQILVFDEMASRFTLLDDTLGFVRSYPYSGPFPWDLALISDGHLLVNGIAYTVDLVGRNLFLGRLGDDFLPVGERQLRVMPGESAQSEMSLVSSANGQGVWATPATKHQLLYINPLGVIVDSITLDQGWFEPWQGSRRNIDLYYPKPYTVDLHQDDEGLIWILTHVAAPSWKEPPSALLEALRHGEGRPVVNPIDRDRFLDSVIEVVDPVGRRTIAAMRVDELYSGFTSDGSLYRLTTDGPEGGYAIEVRTSRLEPDPTQTADRSDNSIQGDT